ncbi:FAD-dependent oxidoreductase [Streptomyces sp. SL13]|uniref:D-amino-acid oxidase n=1 Tax=Streptantibioticus silvisoli TaxID=2705255 RepID=A0AA90H9J0_9ACTN|nr:FAD-dependent oxidoreductase [Streptantibioticus silvisoli]MDI5973660.1 FAD-dependent oxidoreductase [Streptantibioticus silvisoli]
MTQADVIVVGGGVIGLTTAVVLAESGAAVRVWTERTAAHTTSAVAGGLWEPYRIAPREQAERWAVEAFAVFARLAERPAETGVRMVDGLQAQSGAGCPPPGWAASVPGVRPATAAELPDGYRSGHRMRLPLVDMPAYLDHLTRRLTAAGGTVTVRTVGTLDEPAREAPVVVNCTGLGSRELLGDCELTPVRGQLVVVENPGITEWFVDADEESAEPVYFFPQPGRLLLGGTADPGAWDTTPDPAVADAIRRRCARVDPRIAGARVLAHRAGLRPVRSEVRLDREGDVVHHYGHGGAGVTVSWGSAARAAALVTGD